MKNLLALLILLFISTPIFSQNGELTGEECRIKLDSIYNNCRGKKVLKERAKLSSANPNNETSLKDLYYLRNNIDKVVLRNTLDKLSPENQSNKYAKSLDLFINTQQRGKGDQFLDFKAQTMTGKEITLSEILKEKDVLLIIEGLSCIGNSGRQKIIDTYKDIDPNKAEIISFLTAENENQFQEEVNKYNVTWTAVSDFKDILSEVWLGYVTKGTPTCVYINSSGEVLFKGVLISKALRMLKKQTEDE